MRRIDRAEKIVQISARLSGTLAGRHRRSAGNYCSRNNCREATSEYCAAFFDVSLASIIQRLFSGPFFQETAYVARIYSDSLRDNFVGYEPTDWPKFDQLKREYDVESAKSRPRLAELLRIEASLVQLMPDGLTVARLWAVEDRFRRVVPKGTRATYEASVPPKIDPVWKSPEYVRDQVRVMLDMIHANYMLNMGREASVKRLKLLIFFEIWINLAVLMGLFIYFEKENQYFMGLTIIASVGVLGAILSVSNRLQTAVELDAMAQDGIYELLALRMGWVGVLVSTFMGGAFALVLFCLVRADVTSTILPGSGSAQRDNIGLSELTRQSEPPVNVNTLVSMKMERSIPGSQPAEVAKALGLSEMDFYKMLLFALLAGFAERLVPDILNRLSKQSSS